MENKNQVMWSVIQVNDEETDDPKEIHIMPTMESPSFDTEEEAMDFAKKVEDEGCCGIMADTPDGEVMITYFGHTLDRSCDCNPEFEYGIDIPRIIHRHVN